MSRKNAIILSVSVLVIISLIWFFSSDTTSTNESILIEAQEGEFVIDVTTTGELEARSSEDIEGPNPNGLRNARIHRYNIEDIVPDGTVVDSGQWVATLDRSDLENKIKDQELEVEKLETQYVKTQLDTTLTMRAARDDLINLKFQLEEKQIVVDQSLYEPPATQRQVKIDYEKTERSLNQNIDNYQIKKQKAEAEMREVAANLEKSRRVLRDFQDLKKEFIVLAPKSGMVVYKRDWNGKKIGVGSQISMWENVVATLPNLMAMNSKTYINEIDISKVLVGQKAVVEVDAFPGKEFPGEVSEVANMGEQMRNSNAKVFEVMINIIGYDSILKPSMTTKNRIITDIVERAVFIPIECINVDDSISFVYTPGGKKQVITGKTNETSIIIHEGLKDGDELYIVPPDGAEDWSIKYLDKDIIEKYREEEKEEVIETEEKQNKPEPGKFKGRGNGRMKNR
jgi:HlyD family secretion protein